MTVLIITLMQMDVENLNQSQIPINEYIVQRIRMIAMGSEDELCQPSIKEFATYVAVFIGIIFGVSAAIDRAFPEAEAHGGCDLILEWAEIGKVSMNDSPVQWCMDLPPDERPASFFKGEVVTDTKSLILYKMGVPIGLTLAAGVGLVALGICVNRNLKRERM